MIYNASVIPILDKIHEHTETIQYRLVSSIFDREMTEIVGIDRRHLYISEGAICESAPGQSKSMGKGTETQN